MWSMPWIAANICRALTRASLIAAEDEAAIKNAIADGSYWKDRHADNFVDPDARTRIWGDQ